MKIDHKALDLVLLNAGVLEESLQAALSTTVVPTNFKELNQFWQAKLFDSILADDSETNSVIFQELMFCAAYTAELLTFVGHSCPPSWYAVDYVIEGINNNQPQVVKQGADISLLICSIFKDRAKRKKISSTYYQEIGPQLYNLYYQMSGMMTGLYMGRHFQKMKTAASQCLDDLCNT